MPIRKVETKKYPKGYGYQLRIDRKGINFRRIFQTKAEAERIENAIKQRLLAEEFGLPIDNSIRLEELVEAHLPYLQSRNHYGAYKNIVERFRDLIGSDKDVQSITRTELEFYISHRRRDGIADQTINREISEIRTMLSSAWKYFPELDTYHSPRLLRLPEPKGGRQHTWTEEEVKAVLRQLHAPPLPTEYNGLVKQRAKVADMFVLCQLTGLRVGEARTLHRTQVDFDRGIVTVTSKKGGKETRREVPLDCYSLEILKRRAAEGEWIFSNPTNTKPICTHLPIFKTACYRAGINYGLKGGVIFNDARRTVVNFLVEQGVDLRTVGDLAGHAPNTMAERRLRLTEEQRRQAIEKRYKKLESVLIVGSSNNKQEANGQHMSLPAISNNLDSKPSGRKKDLTREQFLQDGCDSARKLAERRSKLTDKNLCESLLIGRTSLFRYKKQYPDVWEIIENTYREERNKRVLNA